MLPAEVLCECIRGVGGLRLCLSRGGCLHVFQSTTLVTLTASLATRSLTENERARMWERWIR